MGQESYQKIVLVTGANRGIGLETARQLRGEGLRRHRRQGRTEWPTGGGSNPGRWGQGDIPFPGREQLRQHPGCGQQVCRDHRPFGRPHQ